MTKPKLTGFVAYYDLGGKKGGIFFGTVEETLADLKERHKNPTGYIDLSKIPDDAFIEKETK